MYSIYIPHIFKSIVASKITAVFHDAGIGRVSQVDLVQNERNNAAYVQFEYLYSTEASENLQSKLLAGERFELRYDTTKPWFWLLYKHISENEELRSENTLLKNYLAATAFELGRLSHTSWEEMQKMVEERMEWLENDKNLKKIGLYHNTNEF